MLLVNLRLCNTETKILIANSDEIPNEFFNKNDVTMNISIFHGRPTISSAKSNTLSLKYILKNIIEWIIVSGVTSQKLRINLYASLLNFLHLVKGYSKDSDSMEITDTLYVFSIVLI